MTDDIAAIRARNDAAISGSSWSADEAARDRHALLAALDAAEAREATLREALRWALDRIVPYRHPLECSPLECSCGYWKAREAAGLPFGYDFAVPEPRNDVEREFDRRAALGQSHEL